MKERNERAAATMGGDDAFILAWGRQNAALAIYRWLLLLLFVVALALVGLVGYLAYRIDQKTVWCFVKDSLGNIVQADPNAFLRAGETRTEVDIKGFVRRWILDGHSWTPVQGKGKADLALLAVKPKARVGGKKGLRLAQRKVLVDRGVSGRVLDPANDPDHQPQILIQSRKPLSVLVTFDTYHILADGALTHLLREALHHLKRHVGFQQGPAHFAHRRIDISLRQAATACEGVEYAAEALA